MVENSDVMKGVLSKNSQLTEKIHNDIAVTDPESVTPDSSMDPITIPKTQLDPIIVPNYIPETLLDVSISDSPALIQTGNITSTPERSVSLVSRTVIHLVRPNHSHVIEDITVLLSQIVSNQNSFSTNGDGFTVIKKR